MRQIFNIGKKWRLEFSEKGFSVWDIKANRWIIDGSLIVESKEFSISSELKNKPTSKNPVFIGLYPIKRKRK